MLNLSSNFFWIFFIYKALWTLNILQGRLGHQLFLVTPNLRLIIFQNFLREGSGPNFFGHTKFETKKFFGNFFIYRMLWTLNFTGGIWAPTFLGHAKFEVKNFSEFFNLQSTVDSEFFSGGGGSGHQVIF